MWPFGATGGCWPSFGSWKPADPAGGRAGRGGNFLLAAMRRRPYPWHPDHMPLRCLLVDDNDAFLKAASVLLGREGMTVAGVASSTAGALRQARALRPDVILVDIGLGEESGFDLARLLARDGHGGGAAVILISARAETDYTELIAQSPAGGFLPKPELSAQRITQILRHIVNDRPAGNLPRASVR